MKIAVSSTGPAIDDLVETRFGRCAYFLLIDTDTLKVEAVQNPNIELGGGAGIQSAQLMANKGASVVLTGNCGPNAFRTFGAAGIQIITGVSGPVREAVAQFKAGKLTYSSTPNAESHSGMGRGMGRRCGSGGGFGQYAGIQRVAGDTGFASSGSSSQKYLSEKGEIESLREAANGLRNQLQSIEARIMDLDKK